MWKTHEKEQKKLCEELLVALLERIAHYPWTAATKLEVATNAEIIPIICNVS